MAGVGVDGAQHGRRPHHGDRVAQRLLKRLVPLLHGFIRQSLALGASQHGAAHPAVVGVGADQLLRPVVGRSSQQGIDPAQQNALTVLQSFQR